MSDTPSSQFDLGEIRTLLEQDGNKYIKGICNRDVDWFLRDSNIGSRTDLTKEDRDKPQNGADSKSADSIGSGSTANGGQNTPSDTTEPSTPIRRSSTSSSATLQGATSSSSKLSPASHLQTTISNTNEHYPSKTKPSVSPIHEENAIPEVNTALTGRSRSVSNPVATAQARRRSTSSLLSNGGSASSNGSASGGGGGFFSKLKGKFHKVDEIVNTPPSPTVSPSPPPPDFNPIFKENFQFGGAKAKTNGGPPPSTTATRKQSQTERTTDDYILTRTMSTPNYADTFDPRLEEYINFYKQKDLRRGSSLSRRSSVASGGNYHSANMSNTYENGSTAIPSHPKESPLPSALVNGFENVTYNKNTSSSPPPSKLSSFLKRRSVSTAPAVNLPLVAIATEKNRRNSDASSITPPSSQPPSKSTNNNASLHPEFSEARPLKRVAFHSSTFLIDPPQQIPSRKPRKGNVEILSNGSLKINPLTEEEKVAIEKSQMGQGGGIVVGGTGALGIIKKTEKEIDESSTDGKDDEYTKVDKHAKSIEIDKPMISHHVSDPNASYSIPVKKMALDLMYTRCCHLREILPIPAILKQIPKGSMAPIPILQLRNPTPTMVEIQTFADFIRIAPIICLSLDGVSLSFEQFKVILSAMSAKRQVEKLSLRNTPIDQEGWSLLCWFLSRNTVINKLDITQCPSLSVNLLRKKKRKPSTKPNAHEQEEIPRMQCNKENRSDMDWGLFTATLVARGGIDELILTGCCIIDTTVFENLIKLAASIRTSRLGLAYNNLSVAQAKVVIDHWIFKPFARGLDFGYNDFSSYQFINVLLKMRRDPKFDEYMKNSSLAFLSLNATNLRFSEAFKEYLETILLRYPNLKYLDLSNNPRLFGQAKSESTNDSEQPQLTHESSESSVVSTNTTSSSNNISDSYSQDAIVSYFTSKLPLFPKLIRLHLENNSFSGNSIISIAKTLPFCKNLGYFSVHGNELDLTAATALLQGLENSKTLITLDCDYEGLPSIFKEKIGLYTMRNMERLLYVSKTSGMPEDSIKVDEQPKENGVISLTEQLNSILARKANDKLDLNDPEVQGFIEKARKIRRDLRSSINDLYKLQVKNELNFDGKEMLIRFLFIESSIERGLQLIDPSLVDSKSATLIDDCIRNNSAENDRNKEPRQPEEEHKSPNLAINTSTTPLSISRNSSKTNLSSLDKNEGSVLKLRKIHDKLKDQVSQSGEEAKESGSKFFDDIDKLSGEEIRKNLLKTDLTDLDKIIYYLGELKEKNISLEEVFNQNSETTPPTDVITVQEKLKKLQSTLKELALKGSGLKSDDEDVSSVSMSNSTSGDSATTSKDNQSAKQSSTSDASDSAAPPTINGTASKQETENVMETYDHVISDLERRINN